MSPLCRTPTSELLQLAAQFLPSSVQSSNQKENSESSGKVSAQWLTKQNQYPIFLEYSYICWGWLGEAKVSCILHHRGVQLILAYSWARPAVLAAGKGRGGMFFFISSVPSLSFIFLSPLSLSFISSTITSVSLLPFSGRQQGSTCR